MDYYTVTKAYTYFCTFWNYVYNYVSLYHTNSYNYSDCIRQDQLIYCIATIPCIHAQLQHSYYYKVSVVIISNLQTYVQTKCICVGKIETKRPGEIRIFHGSRCNQLQANAYHDYKAILHLLAIYGGIMNLVSTDVLRNSFVAHAYQHMKVVMP